MKIVNRAILDTSTSLVIFLKYTKNKKSMAIHYEHFHIFNSCILCPVCVFATALFHRLSITNNAVTHNCFLFVLLTKKGFVPYPTSTFTDILDRVCEQNCWFKMRYHDFKRGLLTWMWYGGEVFYIPDRILHFLGNHTIDYCKNYLYPELRKTFRLVNAVREEQLTTYVNSLSVNVRHNLLYTSTHLPSRTPTCLSYFPVYCQTEEDSLQKRFHDSQAKTAALQAEMSRRKIKPSKRPR